MVANEVTERVLPGDMNDEKADICLDLQAKISEIVRYDRDIESRINLDNETLLDVIEMECRNNVKDVRRDYPNLEAILGLDIKGLEKFVE